MVNIILEKNQSDNVRVNKMLSAIKTYVARKKKEHIEIAYDTSALPQAKAVIVLGSSMKWICNVSEYLVSKRIQAVVFGYESADPLVPVHTLTSDYTAAMYKIAKILLSKDKSDIAFFGYNPDSCSDDNKYKGVSLAAAEAGVNCKVYYNNGSIKKTMDEFLSDEKKYRNVICSNDDLVLYLYSEAENCENLNVGGYGAISAGRNCKYEYVTAWQDFYTLGESLIELYYNVIKSNNDYIKNVIATTRIVNSKDFSETDIPVSGSGKIDAAEPVDYYRDEKIMEIDNIKKFVMSLDDADKDILKEMLEGKTYFKISEANYKAENTIKYRVNKMNNELGTKNKEELLSLIKKYKLQF